VTLILFNSMNFHRRPGIPYRRGAARRLQRISGNPAAQLPGNKAAVIDLEGMFYLSTAALLATYFGLRLLLASRFGRIIVGIRENERRAELLGYDPRAYKLATFTIGGALAGFVGCLFANWGNFVSPTIFGLAQSAQIIIWVIVGGRGTLIGPIVGCIGIQRYGVGGEPSQRFRLVDEAIGQCAVHAWNNPYRVRASCAEGIGADARRFRTMAVNRRGVPTPIGELSY
jgi:hypothetical protein